VKTQLDLFVPTIERSAEIPAGIVYSFAGRPLLVVKCYGSDPAAPVIVEELASFSPRVLRGQLALWSADGVSRAMRRR